MQKLRAGIIGCGCIFPMHAYPLSNLIDVELAAVCDLEEERAKNAAEKFHCKAYTDYHKLIQEEGVDVIHICTPHYLHPVMAIEALNAKINVLTEKPMSIHYQDAVSMIQAAEQNNKTLGVIFQNRYNNSSQLVKKTIESGDLGAILAAKLSVTWKRTQEYYASSDWKGTWEKEGGGVLINQAIHTFDLLRWFVNSEVSSVDATLSNRFLPAIEVEDSAEGIIQFENGVIATFHAINYYAYDAPPHIEIICEKGIINLHANHAIIKFHDGRELTASPDQETFQYGEQVKAYWGIAHHKQIEQFYHAIRTGEPLDILATDALKTQKLICDIYASGKAKWKK